MRTFTPPVTFRNMAEYKDMCKNIVPRPAQNNSGYCNPELDELFVKAEKATDEQKEIEYYYKAQDIIAEDLPVVTMWDRVTPIAYRKGIHGLPPGVSHNENFDSVWRAE